MEKKGGKEGGIYGNLKGMRYYFNNKGFKVKVWKPVMLRMEVKA